mmetsp:Transcript_55837/g.167355  ORF Transcript_55837/g.167355 Transcript_55837/m.167355 type:complete len:233 (+) Transcript_55837:437-1135(+)
MMLPLDSTPVTLFTPLISSISHIITRSLLGHCVLVKSAFSKSPTSKIEPVKEDSCAVTSFMIVPSSTASSNFAFLSWAPEKSALAKLEPVKIAPCKLAPAKLVFWQFTLVKSLPAKSRPEKSCPEISFGKSAAKATLDESSREKVKAKPACLNDWRRSSCCALVSTLLLAWCAGVTTVVLGLCTGVKPLPRRGANKSSSREFVFIISEDDGYGNEQLGCEMRYANTSCSLAK